MRQGLGAVVGIAVIGLAGLLIWLLAGGDGVAPTPADPQPASSTGSGPTPRSNSDARRAAVEMPEAAEQPSEPGPATAAPGDPEPTPEPAARPNLRLVVREQNGNAAVAQFTYALVLPRERRTGEGEAGEAELTVPPNTRIDVVVEAPDHVPFRDVVQSPPPGAPARTLEVFLTRAATATGIVVQLQDQNGTTVEHVRAETWRLPSAAERRAPIDWRRERPLWSRQASDPNGRYELPQLEPGTYGVRLLALDAEGRVRPLQPFVREFTLTGSNGYDERVTLEPGCALGVEVVDSSYRALEPGQRAVEWHLRLAGGPQQRHRWIHRSERGRLAADDAPPVAGRCWLEEPVAPGLYRLVVTVDGTQRADFQLALRAGERQTERLVLP